ncbi:hypothetical protein GGR56DRAFT_419427 [Xylariaceae sp. FL0804]|nr:hypothetical protein GGR56DRAFT_419427 [Xylariaceae sp. FL0804]
MSPWGQAPATLEPQSTIWTTSMLQQAQPGSCDLGPTVPSARLPLRVDLASCFGSAGRREAPSRSGVEWHVWYVVESPCSIRHCFPKSESVWRWIVPFWSTTLSGRAGSHPWLLSVTMPGLANNWARRYRIAQQIAGFTTGFGHKRAYVICCRPASGLVDDPCRPKHAYCGRLIAMTLNICNVFRCLVTAEQSYQSLAKYPLQTEMMLSPP